MPAGTEVHKLYKKLLAEGHNKETAARIAQFQTKMSLRSGKKSKKKNSAVGAALSMVK